MAKVWKKLQRADSAFTGDVTGSINGASAASVKSGSALGTSSNQDSTSTIRSGVTAANVGLGNVANESRATILAGTFTGDVGGTSAADIRSKAIAAKDAVDGNASVTMVGGSINIGSGEWIVDSSGNQVVNGTVTINKETGGTESGLTMNSGSSGDMKFLMQGANPAIDMGGTAPLGASTLYIRRSGTSTQSRIFFVDATTTKGCIGFANQPSSLNTQFAMHTAAIYDNSSPYTVRNFTMDADNKIGFYANDKSFAGVTIDTDGTNKGLYVASGGISIGTATTSDNDLRCTEVIASGHGSFNSIGTGGIWCSALLDSSSSLNSKIEMGGSSKFIKFYTDGEGSGDLCLTLASDHSATFAGPISVSTDGLAGSFTSAQTIGLRVQGGGNSQAITQFRNVSGVEKFSIDAGGDATFAGDVDIEADCKVVGGLGIGTANTNAGHLVVKNSLSAGEILIGSDDKPVKGGWHSATKIFITPADFIVNDDNNYYNVALVDNGGELKAMTSALEAYCNFTIPDGYKAVSFRLNGTASVVIGATYSDITTGSATSCQPPSNIYTNTEYAFYSSAVASTTNGRYIILKWAPTSTSHRLYGGYIIIEPS